MAIFFEYETGNAIVRFHSGKRTEEERNQIIRIAAEEYFSSILPQLQKLGLDDVYARKVEKEGV